jgi:hypothetical protein
LGVGARYVGGWERRVSRRASRDWWCCDGGAVGAAAAAVKKASQSCQRALAGLGEAEAAATMRVAISGAEDGSVRTAWMWFENRFGGFVPGASRMVVMVQTRE